MIEWWEREYDRLDQSPSGCLVQLAALALVLTIAGGVVVLLLLGIIR